jgi:hypothetical protein
MSLIIFEKYKAEIQTAIEAKISAGVISDPAGFILIDGFINLPFQTKLDGSFSLGGNSIPSVAVVGKSTGLINTFALKILLPGIQL